VVKIRSTFELFKKQNKTLPRSKAGPMVPALLTFAISARKECTTHRTSSCVYVLEYCRVVTYYYTFFRARSVEGAEHSFNRSIYTKWCGVACLVVHSDVHPSFQNGPGSRAFSFPFQLTGARRASFSSFFFLFRRWLRGAAQPIVTQIGQPAFFARDVVP